MTYRPYSGPSPLLFGYDPLRDLPDDHLARLVEAVVEGASLPRRVRFGKGQPAFDPRLLAKVLVYGYAIGIRSSRMLERMCSDCLSFLFLTRGDTPSYHTISSFRVKESATIDRIFKQLFEIATECNMPRLGRIVIDSSKFRANASPESVVKAKHYDALLAELKQILKEAEEADKQDEMSPPGQTLTGEPVETERMRDIIRRVQKRSQAADKTGDKKARAQAASGDEKRKPLGPKMQPRIEDAIATIEQAKEEGRQHACLTDPDARMMGEGREKHIRECHSFEVVVDRDAGLLVVGQSCQSGTDNPRLDPLVEAAAEFEPGGVTSVDADSGYYGGDAVGRLIERGLDTCIPDSHTACDLHRGQPIGMTRDKGRGSVELTFDCEANCYQCPQGNPLLPVRRKEEKGQQVTVYRTKRSCTRCPLAAACLKQPDAKHRTINRGDYTDILEEARQKFADPDHLDRYYHRGEVVETVFAFIRSTLGYNRWLLRGAEKVACEANLFKLAYQLRKVHSCWAWARA